LQPLYIKNSIFTAASQNLNEESIFIWDLYKKRSYRQFDEKFPDQPEAQLNFKNNDLQIKSFLWNKNSSHLNVLTNVDNKNESIFLKFNLGFVDRKFNSFQEKEEIPKTANENEKMTINVNLGKLDKSIECHKLQSHLSSFQLLEKSPDKLFAMNQTSDFMIDLNDKNNYVLFGNGPSSSNTQNKGENTCHIESNGDNYVIFAKTNQCCLYDIRKVKSKEQELHDVHQLFK